MEIDKTTLADLLIVDNTDEFSIFCKINFALTTRGKEQLKTNLLTPQINIASIEHVQQTILHIKSNIANWPTYISNGTLMVVERYYESQIDALPTKPTYLDGITYKILHTHDFLLVKYSVKYCYEFIKGMQQLVVLFGNANTATLLQIQIAEMQKILMNKHLKIIFSTQQFIEVSRVDMLALAYFFRHHFKLQMYALLTIFGKLDAWYGMAVAVAKYNLAMPTFVKSDMPFLEAKGLYHLMLQQPVGYNVALTEQANFLFLTGANMAGKSTFIKACGTAVYLAHVGMGVPAQHMQLSFFDGIISNINVIDNIAKGESYFYNEVQRIKTTVQKINNNKKWLVLIDELFKGTNVQDAMKCSTAVIEGLLKIKSSTFILSTHLYEIGDAVKHYPNMVCNYFETAVIDEQLHFSYQLKNGISNDRLGYLILKREGVVALLNDL